MPIPKSSLYLRAFHAAGVKGTYDLSIGFMGISTSANQDRIMTRFVAPNKRSVVGAIFSLFDVPLQTGELSESWQAVIDKSHDVAVRIFFVSPCSLVSAQNDRGYRHALQLAEFCYGDGWRLTFAARFLSAIRLPILVQRNSWIEALFDRLQQEGGGTLFCLGVRGESFQSLPQVIASRWPQITLIGTHGRIAPEEEDAIVSVIEQRPPTILLIGSDTSSPERLICRHWHQLKNVGVRMAIAGGTVIDEMTGSLPRFFLVARALHMQWIFYLIFHPRFFFECYIACAFRFLWLLLKQKGKQEQGIN